MVLISENKKFAEGGFRMGKSIVQKIDDYFKGLEEKHEFSGSVLISKGDNIIINQGYGMANYDLEVHNTSETKFCLASISKSITVMAIMLLVEQEKFKIDDTLDKFIPDYPNGEKITIYHLITHTSGIYEIFNDPEYKVFAYKQYTVEELIEKFKDKPLNFEPGARFEYSNSGYILLGYIIEKVSGKSYEQYIKENIFDQLSLQNSGFVTNEQIIKNKATGYSKSDGKITNAKLGYFPVGAANIYSTVGDLYIWVKALLKGKFFGEELRNKMFTEHVHAMDNFYYGYGFVLGKTEDRIDFIYQDGGTSGYKTIYLIYPQKDVILIILSNFDFIKFDQISDQIEQFLS